VANEFVEADDLLVSRTGLLLLLFILDGIESMDKRGGINEVHYWVIW